METIKPSVSMKFGGTSMGSAHAIRECGKIISEALSKKTLVVTVSAVSGTTDKLLLITSLAKNKKIKKIAQEIQLLLQKHKEIFTSLLSEKMTGGDFPKKLWEKQFQPLFDDLLGILHGAILAGEIGDKVVAKVLSFGERVASQLMSFYLSQQGIPCAFLSGEEVIRTNGASMEADVDFHKTMQHCKKKLLPLIHKGIVPVVMGFVGEDNKGNTTLLGRGGSDYTASIIAVCLDMSAVEIWTDVNGIMSCDPRVLENAISWKKLDMNIVCEMAFSGAKVIHPKSIAIATSKNIPVYIKNTFDPSFEGTEITHTNERGIRGITIDTDYVLLNVENPKMLDNIGFIAHFSNLVAEKGVPIDVFVTAETSFTFSVKKRYFTKSFKKKLNKIATIHPIEGVSKISIVGGRITEDMSVLYFLSKIFYENNWNIHALSMGASYNNITLIVDEHEAKGMLVECHQNFFEKPVL